jgi:hypothetical protein
MRSWIGAAAAIAVAVGTLGAVVGAQPASALAGTSLVVARSTYDSVSSKTATATCPANKVLLGGGGRVVDGSGYVILWSLSPSNTAYRADAYEKQAFGGAWEVYAYAICGDPIAGRIIVTDVETIAAGVRRDQADVACPQGTKVLGTGGWVNGADASFEWIRPYDNGGNGTVVVEGIDNGAAEWEIGAMAVCAPAPAGYEIGATGTLAYTGPVLQISSTCSGNKTLTGAGMTKWDPSRTAVADGMFPTADLRTVWVNSRQPTTTNPVNLGAWTICAS